MADFTKTTTWTGKTFEIRTQLKNLGATWSDEKKQWMLPAVGRREIIAAQRLSLRAGVEVANAE